MNNILCALFCLLTTTGFTQAFKNKQTLIPLDNIKGVPFYKDPELPDLIVDGFEIDKKGNYYFLAGDKTSCLAVFSGNKQVYRKKFQVIHPTSLHLNKNKLYTFFLSSNGVNDLLELNVLNGDVVKRYSRLASVNVMLYTFADSTINIGTFRSDTVLYFQYSLNGKYIKTVTNPDNINDEIVPANIGGAAWEFVGRWNNNFIFWNPNPESSKYEKLCMVDSGGRILATKLLPYRFSGDGYAGNPPEDRKVRNGSLYVLGRKGKFAMITEVPLKDFFKQ